MPGLAPRPAGFRRLPAARFFRSPPKRSRFRFLVIVQRKYFGYHWQAVFGRERDHGVDTVIGRYEVPVHRDNHSAVSDHIRKTED
jgi:hypothetical protein